MKARHAKLLNSMLSMGCLAKIFSIRFLAAFICGFCLVAVAMADGPVDPTKMNVGFKPELGLQLDLSLEFTDQLGVKKTLREAISKDKPTILVPMYYECPMLCGLLINSMIDLIGRLKLELGTDYKVVSVSFDPTEDVRLARKKSNNVYKEIQKPQANDSSWEFLVGAPEPITRLMSQIGFRYEKQGSEYVHSSGFIVLTPDGAVSQYFTGVDFPDWDVRLSIVEASQGKVGNPIDHILLFCYSFDPTQGKYTLAAYNVLRIGVLIFIALCALFVFKYSRRVKTV